MLVTGLISTQVFTSAYVGQPQFHGTCTLPSATYYERLMFCESRKTISPSVRSVCGLILVLKQMEVFII